MVYIICHTVTMNKCNNSTRRFEEAERHCRWKGALRNVLKEINIAEYKDKPFEEIIAAVYSICRPIKGLGPLTMYDITAEICRYHRIHIERVYIIGGGPRRAVKLLGITTKTHNIGGLRLKYADITEVIRGFDVNGYELDASIRKSMNGDLLESYICNWQKAI